MTTTMSRPPARGSVRRDVLRGIGAFLALGGIVAGVPWLLATLVGWPLPRKVPDVGRMMDAIGDSYIPDELLVNVIAVVCWIIWAQLVASIVLEAIGSIRGRSAPTVPLGGSAQRLAGRLVAAVALLIMIFASRGGQELTADAVRPLMAPTMISVFDEPLDDDVHAEAEQAAPAADVPTYEVQRRDTLWDVAERHLGDPFRWTEIWEMNRGVPQADGASLTDPDRIYAGWVLCLPSDAVGLATSAAPTAAAAEVSTEAEADSTTRVSAADADAADSGADDDLSPDVMRPIPPTAEAPALAAPDDGAAGSDADRMVPLPLDDADR